MNETLAQTIATTTTTTAKRRSRSGAKHPPATTFTPLIPPLPSATELTNQPVTKKPQSKNNSALAKKQPSAAGSTSETDAGGPNPYLRLVFRRMRRLKKRVTRVETTEAALNKDPSKKATLEPDQLAALEKKLEMSAPLKELEDLFKAMTVLQHLRDIERSKETATRETQESATLAFIQVIRLFYALKQLDDAKEYLTLPLSNSLKVLEKFRSCLFEVAQAAELSDGDDCIHSRKELYSMVRKLAEKSTDNVAEESDITYKCIYDEIDHLTYPSTDLELRDTPLISDDRQVDGPSSTMKAHTGAGKEDDIEGTSVRSLTAAQKSSATVENWFSKISSSSPPSSESPPKTTPGQESMAVAQTVNAKQTEPTPAVAVCLGREVASQTDPSASCEPSSLPAVTAFMVPTVVPLVPVHPMSDYRFMLPPWVAGSSYPADPHVSNPSLMQAQTALPGMHVSNEPGHSIFSQPDDKDSGKSDSPCRFGRPSGGPSQESTSLRAHRVPQESYGQSGDDRLGVIYEDDEKECGASSSARAHGHGQYMSYVPVPIYQDPKQLQATNPNQRGTQDRMVARTITESAGSEVRRGVSPLSGDQLRQQQVVYGHSSGVMTLQQSESTSFGYKVSGTGSKKELPTDNNNGRFQGRRSGKKTGRGQDRPPLGQTQHQQGGLKSQDQGSTESSSNLQHSASYHSHSDAQNQQYYLRMTQQQQQNLQQQHCHLDEQVMSLLPQQQQQQGVYHYVQQQAFYQYPGGWYFPGYGGGGGGGGGGEAPVYCVQRQQIQQTQAEDASKGQV
ncbi:hypothetical protein EC957_009707 [Mortierella hygrophila]|uniref:Uncharacterized protein n=1 Tax=Mortierella hygrophila TaxID=979708 RepID=A0A9P6FAU7_9FUNG|nr:hypothetical protein EC957_009707 [Mortierella hygrophila]